jgi:hypothetical protein
MTTDHAAPQSWLSSSSRTLFLSKESASAYTFRAIDSLALASSDSAARLASSDICSALCRRLFLIPSFEHKQSKGQRPQNAKWNRKGGVKNH